MPETFDNSQAIREGWNIQKNAGGILEPVKLASGASFFADNAAVRAFVATQALEGSAYHIAALSALQEKNPKSKNMTVLEQMMNDAARDWVGECPGDGCFISHCSGTMNGDIWQLQKDDSSAAFEDDDEAAVYVTKRAAEGSEYHRRVLRFLEVAQPNEAKRIAEASAAAADKSPAPSV